MVGEVIEQRDPFIITTTQGYEGYSGSGLFNGAELVGVHVSSDILN